jgi:GNAT superfamily N-acetyltransferase
MANGAETRDSNRWHHLRHLESVSERARAEVSILPTTILLTTVGSIETELASTMAVNEQLLGPRLEVPRRVPRVPLRARESSVTPLTCGAQGYGSVLGRSLYACLWSLKMEASAREGLLVDGAGAPLAEEDSGSVELLDGTHISYRAIVPDNAAALQRFHHRLSERSIYLRFFSAKPELSGRKAGYFTNVDGTNRFALVALDPERSEEIIAVVSFDREGNPERAEYAAAVEDRWQGRGLGLALTRRLIEAALKRGIRVFTGIVLPENARMLNLLRDLNLPERLRFEEGVEYVEIDLLPGA